MLKLNKAVIILLCVSGIFISCEKDELAQGEGEVITLVKEEDLYTPLDISTVYVSIRAKRLLNGLYFMKLNDLKKDSQIEIEYYFTPPLEVEYTEKGILRRFNSVYYISLILLLEEPINPDIAELGDKIVVDIGKYTKAFTSSKGGIMVFNQMYTAKIVRNISKKMDIE